MSLTDRAAVEAERRHQAGENATWGDPRSAFIDGVTWADARAVSAVRDLHHPWGDTLSGTRVCDECDQAWPCPTVRALDGDE